MDINEILESVEKLSTLGQLMDAQQQLAEFLYEQGTIKKIVHQLVDCADPVGIGMALGTLTGRYWAITHEEEIARLAGLQ